MLRSLLHDLAQHCTILRERLTNLQSDPIVADHILSAYKIIETVRRAILQLIASPDLQNVHFLRLHLRAYKRMYRTVTLVESYLLPFVERIGAEDKKITNLCALMMRQVRWPLPSPVVGAFSSSYYWTYAPFNVICVPAAEGTGLLGLADLDHEMGHILMLAHRDLVVGSFPQEVADYIRNEQRKVRTLQKSEEYIELYGSLLVQWEDEWLQEFVSDMIATFLVGPAFGWQHIRLCTGNSNGVYFPGLGESNSHPADEARLRGIMAVLHLIGSGTVISELQTTWDAYLGITAEPCPPEYDVCYPQPLIDSLARQVVEGCLALGLRGFNECDPSNEGDVPALLNLAWHRFRTEPETYAHWEKQQLERLSASLN